MKTIGKLAAQAGKPNSRSLASTPQRRASNGVLSRAALHFLLGETIAFLLAAGLSRRSLAAELRKEASQIGSGRTPQRSRVAKVIKQGRENLVEIAGVIHDWHRQSTYTDSRSGEPRPLRESELLKLIGKRFPRKKVASALDWMMANGIIQQRKQGLFAVSTGRHVVLRDQRRLAMERAAALVLQYLRISLRNAVTSNPKSRDIDRDARVFFLPDKWVGLWRAVARERTEAFLEGVDNWLEDHTRPEDVGPVREVAVHCYSYTGEPRSPKPSATNIGRLEGEG